MPSERKRGERGGRADRGLGPIGRLVAEHWRKTNPETYERALASGVIHELRDITERAVARLEEELLKLDPPRPDMSDEERIRHLRRIRRIAVDIAKAVVLAELPDPTHTSQPPGVSDASKTPGAPE